MKSFDYFKKTFVFVFVLTFIFKFSSQILDGLNTITLKFTLKAFLGAFFTALILAVLNYYFKMGFIEKKK